MERAAGECIAVHHVHQGRRAIELYSVGCREGKQVRKVFRVRNVHCARRIVHAVVIVPAGCRELFIVRIARPDLVEKLERRLLAFFLFRAAFCRAFSTFRFLRRRAVHAKFIVDHVVGHGRNCVVRGLLLCCRVVGRRLGLLLGGRRTLCADGVICLLACAGRKAKYAGEREDHCDHLFHGWFLLWISKNNLLSFSVSDFFAQFGVLTTPMKSGRPSCDVMAKTNGRSSVKSIFSSGGMAAPASIMTV